MDNLRERLDADYFGFYDDETTPDNLKLEELEAEAEKQCKLCNTQIDGTSSTRAYLYIYMVTYYIDIYFVCDRTQFVDFFLFGYDFSIHFSSFLLFSFLLC